MSRYQPYPSYKESDVEWLGDAPEHWECYRIDWISKIVRGNTGFKKDELLENGEYVALQYGKVYKVDEVTETYKFYVNGEFFKDSQVVHQGDTILVSTSETIEDLGHSCFYNREDVGLIGGEQILLKPYTEIVFGKYLYYFSRVFNSKLRQFATGLKVFRFSTDDLKNLFLELPPFSEQTAIANFLDYETAKIDTLIAKQERMIELLGEKRSALIFQAVTKGIDPKVKMKDSGVEWLREVPEHWEVKKTKTFFKLVTQPAPANNDYELLSIYTDIGVRPRKDLEAKGNKASTTDSYWMVEKGDLIVNKLLAWMGAIGYSAYDGVTSPAYDILRPSLEVNSMFYHYLFRTKIAQQEFKRWSRGIMEMRLRLYFDELGNLPMPVPPKEEQSRIVEYIQKSELKIDTLIEKAQKAIELMKERRTALISAAVTGKIDVRGNK